AAVDPQMARAQALGAPLADADLALGHRFPHDRVSERFFVTMDSHGLARMQFAKGKISAAG
ncbi:MAG: hypothetical protein ACRD37_00760, partial [Candidatus Acidiferrales bacterium]